MSTIQLSCVDQVMTVQNTPVIASGGLEENRLQVTFCENWNGFAKTALFWMASLADATPVLLDEAGSCVIPAENTAKPGLLKIGVYGVNAEGHRRTSEVVTYAITQGAYTQEAEPEEPTPDVYMQILAAYAHMEEVYNNRNTAIEEHMGKTGNPHGTTAADVGADPAGAAAAVQKKLDSTNTLLASTRETLMGSRKCFDFWVGSTDDWDGIAAPYTQAIPVPGVLVTDKPVVDILPNEDYQVAEPELEAYGQIYRIVTAADCVTVYAKEKTTTPIHLQMQVCRIGDGSSAAYEAMLTVGDDGQVSAEVNGSTYGINNTELAEKPSSSGRYSFDID